MLRGYREVTSEPNWSRNEEKRTDVSVSGRGSHRAGCIAGLRPRQGRGGGRGVWPTLWLERFFAEMEKPGKGGSGLEAKTRSNLLSGKRREAGLGKTSPGQGAQIRADPASW